MVVHLEKEIFIKAGRSYELLQESIKLAQELIAGNVAVNDPRYYRARNFLKEGKAYLDQTIQHARKLLGPIPIYAAKDFDKWREQILVENKIIIKGESVEEIVSDLEADNLMKSIFDANEIREYLSRNYEIQKKGKRKLTNIKIRMIIDKLIGLQTEAVELNKQAQKKQQNIAF